MSWSSEAESYMLDDSFPDVVVVFRQGLTYVLQCFCNGAMCLDLALRDYR